MYWRDQSNNELDWYPIVPQALPSTYHLLIVHGELCSKDFDQVIFSINPLFLMHQLITGWWGVMTKEAQSRYLLDRAIYVSHKGKSQHHEIAKFLNQAIGLIDL